MPKDKLMRYARLVRIAGFVVIAGVLAFVLYQVYDFYSDKVGYTAPKAIKTYFSALASGDEEEVYRLTAKDRLVDIYGRPITQAEFYRQIRRLSGGRSLPFESIEATKLAERGNAHYYLVTLVSSVGGVRGESRLLIELRKQSRTWVITYPFAIVL